MKHSVADVDQAFCKLALVGNAVELRSREGEWLIRVEADSPRKAMRKFREMLDTIEEHQKSEPQR